MNGRRYLIRNWWPDGGYPSGDLKIEVDGKLVFAEHHSYGSAMINAFADGVWFDDLDSIVAELEAGYKDIVRRNGELERLANLKAEAKAMGL